MPDPSVKPGTARCKRDYHKLNVKVVSAVDDSAIKGAPVKVSTQDRQKASARGGSCTLSTKKTGEAKFTILPGSYEAKVTGPTVKGVKRFVDNQTQGPIQVATKDEEATVKLTPVYFIKFTVVHEEDDTKNKKKQRRLVGQKPTIKIKRPADGKELTARADAEGVVEFKIDDGKTDPWQVVEVTYPRDESLVQVKLEAK